MRTCLGKDMAPLPGGGAGAWRLLAGLAFLALLSAHAAPQAAPPVACRRLLLPWAATEFLAVEGTRLRLQHRYAAAESPILWLEAEGASSIELEAGKTVAVEPSAAGGACVAYVDKLQFVIDVASPGTYQSWMRCFFPFAASWNHTEGIDPKDMRVVSDLQPSDTDKAGRWVWLKGPAYELRPGVCTYVVDGFHGGAKLDRLVLSRDLAFVPEGAGAAASPNLASHVAGRAETRDLRLGPVARWEGLEGLPARGVSAAVSLDGGATWIPAGPGGSLQALPPPGAGNVTVRVRLDLTRDAAVDPIVENIQLAYVPREQRLWTLENAHLRLGFDPFTGSLVGLENLAGPAPVAYLTAAEQQPLFCVFVQQPGAPDTLVPLSSLDAELTGHASRRRGQALDLDFALLQGRLRVRCTIVADATPLTRWTLQITNESDAKVFGAQFPILSNLRLGSAAEDDVMVLPWWGAGSRTENPASAEWSTFRNVLNYPGSASMQWLDLYDPSGGLYVAAYDPTGQDLEIGYTQNRGQSVNVSLRKAFMLPRGQASAATVPARSALPLNEWSCTYVIGVHRGDWHWGADRYREWAGTWLKPPPVPEWLAATDGWMLPDGANFFGYPSLPLHYRSKNALLGMTWMQCWMQMTESEHCCGQFHYPSPLWGTLDDFRWACQEVHDQGGRIGFYINAQLFKPWHNNQAATIGAVPTEFIPADVLAPYDPQWASRWQAKDFADRPYDQPSADPLADGVRMNPASSGWQDHLIHWAADWYVDRFGADCIYLDQLNASRSLPVYDDARTDYGLWGAGYQQTLNRLLARIRPSHPGFVLSAEGSTDLHSQQVAAALYGTGPDLFDLYHYTFPEHILIDFGAFVNQSGPGFPGPHATYLNTFLMGTRFCEYPPDDFGRGLISLRRRLQSLVFRATYRDTVGVTVADPAVRAKRFERYDGNCRAVLVNLGNLQKKDGVAVGVDLAPLAGAKAAWLFGLDGSVRALPVQVGERTVTFAAPPLEAATALFVEKIGPVIEALDTAPSVTTGTALPGTVRIGNYSGQPMRGQVSWRLPDGWQGSAVAFKALPPGTSQTFAVEIRVPLAAGRATHDLTLVATGTGGEDQRYLGLAVVPPVELTEVRLLDDGVASRVRNRSPRRVAATVEIDTFAEALAPAPQQVSIEPGAEVALRLPVSWPDLAPARLPRTVRVAASAEGLRTVRSLTVGPLVINGGFERPAINGDKPEGWSIFGNRHDCVHVVAEQPFEGKACLRVETAPSSPNVDQVIPLQPDTTYRLSAAFRRAEAGGRPLVWITLRSGTGPGNSQTVRLELPPTDTTAGEWRSVASEFTTPAQVLYTFLYACNGGGSGPVWIDAVKVEKMPPAR